MAQLFPESANSTARISLILVAGALASVVGVAYGIYDSAYIDRRNIARNQKVPFSHKHHVGGLGLDCRYCHIYVEEQATAGIPPTHTCMTCHSQVWTEAPILEPVRESYRENKPMEWTRVHDLPDFVYFNHSIHVTKGVGCFSCHGRVDQMPLMWNEHSLQMSWCLDCHRNPEPHIRPKDAQIAMPEPVFNVAWERPKDQPNLGRELVEKHNVQSKDNCYICHR